MKLYRKGMIVWAGLAGFFLLQSCGIFKKTPSNPVKTHALADIRKNIKLHAFPAPYLKTKIKIRLETPERNIKLSGQIRMIKDSAIYISIHKMGFPVAKAIITPEEAGYYENITKTYYRGNIKDLSRILGIALSYEQFENLITGDPLVFPDEDNWNITGVENGQITLEPTRQDNIVFMILNAFYKTQKAQLQYQNEEGTLEYPSYYKDKNLTFPQKIIIDSGENHVEIEMNPPQTDKRPDIRFKWPGHYKRVDIQ